MSGWTRAVKVQLMGGLILGLVVITAGCGKIAKAPAKKEPPKVQVARPVSEKVTDYEECVGRTKSVHSVEVRSQVSGYLDSGSLDKEGKPRFKEGDFVKKGDLL